MRYKATRLGLILALIFYLSIAAESQTVRIMPLGNSITYDENGEDKTNPRPAGQRRSYRYQLYQLMLAEDYNFDYVGSENSGNDYFQNTEYDDNAGFPGVTVDQLSTIINTGWNSRAGVQESPGPYFVSYPADIILLHIGTNDVEGTSSNDVQYLLGRIRFYNPDAIILVARIINRASYDITTTNFNNNVEQMVEQLADPKILMVDMEDGAGINYSSDMADNLHPNTAGYMKMAYKWFEALQNLNEAPVLTQIPEQFTQRDVAFDPISLDNYVDDPEDEDYELSWSYTSQLGSQLIVSIDPNRVLRVTPNSGWSGTEVLTLEVKDSGGDVFPRTSKVLVGFTVKKGNDPPVITSIPVTEVDQNDTYTYQVVAVDVDEDPITFSVITKPSWLTFNQDTKVLSGIPQNEDVGTHNVNLRVADDSGYTEQPFQIEVMDVNDPPYFDSSPELEAEQGKPYSYVIYAMDPDEDQVDVEVIQKPTWLSYNSQTKVLSGIPTLDDLGPAEVELRASDGESYGYQEFTIQVINPNIPPEFLSEPPTEVMQDDLYHYNVIIRDGDGGSLALSARELPVWLTLNPDARSLSGTPGNGEIGDHPVILQVSDGSDTVDQAYQVTVVNVNDPPVFTSDPISECKALQAYIYKIEVEDIDPEDNPEVSVLVKPNWLNFTSGAGEALLFGTPTKASVGKHGVILSVTDGFTEIVQTFNITVDYPLSDNGFSVSSELKVYPNPTSGLVSFSLENPGDAHLKIFDSSGVIRLNTTMKNTNILEVNISEFERGIYFFEIQSNEIRKTGKLLKH